MEQPFLGLHAVDIYVRDQDRSVAFFVEKLGFTLAFDARVQSGERWVAVAPPDGGAALALIAPARNTRQHKLIGRATGVVFVTENVLAKFEEWRRRGVRFLNTPRLRRVKFDRSSDTAIWGGIFTRFQDVDGNSFALVGFDEVNRAIEARRRTAAEKLEAQRRTERELEIAKQVQYRLFPQRLPPVASLEYAGACVQARQVGGDYHDFLDLGRGRFGLLLADIAGKGIAAALLMANLQANVRSQCASAGDEPARLLDSVNRLFYENSDESAYATMFFGEYDERSGHLRYANCGHLPALILRRGGCVERLESTCTVLGLFRQWDCAIAENCLAPGDLLALYSDGVTESCSDAGDEFGESGLLTALERCRELPASQAVTSIVEEVQRFGAREQHDDITLIVARCRA